MVRGYYSVALSHIAASLRAVLLVLCIMLFADQAVHGQSLADLALRSISLQPAEAITADKVSYITYRVPAVEGAFNGVIVSGSSQVEEPAGAIRFDDDPEGIWHPLTFLKSKKTAPFLAGYRSEAFRTDAGFTIRFEAALGDLELREAGVFDNREDEDTTIQHDEQPEGEGSDAPLAAIVPPSLIPRGEWGADPFIRGDPVPLARPSYTRMTFHHAACCSAFSYEEGIAQVKSIQDFHQDIRGWSDIGYHFILDQEGRVYQGRPFLDSSTNLTEPPRLAQGAHVGGANTGNIGVAMLGCYHPNEGDGCVDVLAPATRDSLTAVFAYINERYGVETGDLFGHRDQTNTACPGDNNYAILPQLRLDIAELVRVGNLPFALGELAASSSESNVVQLDGEIMNLNDVAAFRIEREIDDENAVVIFSAEEAGPFSLVDATVPGGGTVQYVLYATSARGQEQRVAETTLELESPDTYIMGQAFPNPFTTSATIRYYVEFDGFVHLEVYNASGERVRNLVDAYQRGGQWYQAVVGGEGLANGVYFYRMRVISYPGTVFDETRTLHLLR